MQIYLISNQLVAIFLKKKLKKTLVLLEKTNTFAALNE